MFPILFHTSVSEQSEPIKKEASLLSSGLYTLQEQELLQKSCRLETSRIKMQSKNSHYELPRVLKDFRRPNQCKEKKSIVFPLTCSKQSKHGILRPTYDIKK